MRPPLQAMDRTLLASRQAATTPGGDLIKTVAVVPYDLQ
jgi:hypothetical protein